MSTPASPQPDDGFEVVVAADGSLPAAELARYGVRPGVHLRLLLDQQPAKRKTMRGAYAHLVGPGEMDGFVAAMAEAKADRIDT